VKGMNFFPKIIFLIILIWNPLFSRIPSYYISGIIIDGDTHQPVMNALVKLSGKNIITYSDDKGAFSFSGLSDTDYVLEIKNIGYRDYTRETKAVNEPDKKMVIHLYPLPVNAPSVVIHGDFSHQTIIGAGENSIVMEGIELQRNLGLSLASTLKNEVGIGMRSMGPATARPVIRGLSGDRITIQQDNNNTNDLSATSPDHAVTIETLTMDYIEVFRGPRVLTKTGNAVGGVINVVSNDLPSELHSNISGNLSLYGETANKGYSGSGSLLLPINPFALKIEITKRNSSDLHTAEGIMPNSSINNFGFSTGASYISTNSITGISIREFNSNYGVPGGFVGAHPKGIDIEMFRRSITGKTEYLLEHSFVEKILLNFNRSYYRHTEKEKSGLTGAEFIVKNYDLNLSINNREFTFFTNGETGITLSQRDFDIGGYVFTPKTESKGISAFIFQTINKDNYEIQSSLRFEHSSIKPYREYSSKIGKIRSRDFSVFSFSLSAVYKISEHYFAGGNINRSSRIPSIEELFSEGPHLAAYSYETGNPDLESERGYGFELFFNYKSGTLSTSLNLFRNDFSYYIIPRNSGETNWSTLLPIYSTEGTGAILSGIENETELKISESFQINQSLSYTYGKIKHSNSSLPMIPPLKIRMEIIYKNKFLSLGINNEIVASQNLVDVFEQKTPGYNVSSCYIQYTFLSGLTGHNLSINLDNIFNTSFRNHLSRIKSILPEPGRNVRLTYRMFF